MKNKSVQNCRFVHHTKFHCIMTTLNRLFKFEFERGGGETGKEPENCLFVFYIDCFFKLFLFIRLTVKGTWIFQCLALIRAVLVIFGHNRCRLKLRYFLFVHFMLFVVLKKSNHNFVPIGKSFDIGVFCFLLPF